MTVAETTAVEVEPPNLSNISTILKWKQPPKLPLLWAVVVVKWSACQHSNLSIPVQIPLILQFWFYKFLETNENKQQESEFGLFFKKEFPKFVSNSQCANVRFIAWVDCTICRKRTITICRMCDFTNVRFRECAISRMCDFANVRFRERVLPPYKFRCLLSKDLLSVYCFDCNGFIDQVRMEGSVIVAWFNWTTIQRNGN